MVEKTKTKLTFSKIKRKSGNQKKKVRPPMAVPEVEPASPPPAAKPATPAPTPAHVPPVPPPPAPAPVAPPIPIAQPVEMPPPLIPMPPLEKTMLRGRIVQAPSAPVNAPPHFKETEDLKEQVGNYLEICDSCMEDECEPTDVIDLIHELIMSLNLDVVSMALIDPALNGRFKKVVSRGYDIPPTHEVIGCWEMALTAKSELLWDKLMLIATDKKTELAYWVVKEHLDSVGYVPIRDGHNLYGFLFVASKTKKEHSIIKSELLDACGTRLGLAYSSLYQ